MDEFDFEYADELEAMEDVDRKFFHLYLVECIFLKVLLFFVLKVDLCLKKLKLFSQETFIFSFYVLNSLLPDLFF